jgi:hypothetical protein
MCSCCTTCHTPTVNCCVLTDHIKGLFPKVNPKKEFGKFFVLNTISGGLAGAGSLAIGMTLHCDYIMHLLVSLHVLALATQWYDETCK